MHAPAIRRIDRSATRRSVAVIAAVAAVVTACGDVGETDPEPIASALDDVGAVSSTTASSSTQPTGTTDAPATTAATTTTDRTTTTTDTTTDTTTTTTHIDTTTTEATTTTAPGDAPLTVDEARALIESLGDWQPIMDTYDPEAALSAVEAAPPGAASAAAPEQIFLFAAGRYVGTPTPEFRIFSSFERLDDTSLRLTYGQFLPTDPFCCPSLEPWVVDVQWDGRELVFSGELPPSDQGFG